MIRTLTDIAYEWGCRCFGAAHMLNTHTRALRFAEESIELAQACRVSKETMHRLVDMIYAKAPGSQFQEAGGVMVTFSVLCKILEIDPEKAFDVEVRRCLSKDQKDFAARNQQKNDMGLF